MTPDGLSLLTRHWGTRDARAAMLIVHGVSEHVGRWTHVADFFVDRGYEVHAYDHRGHGASSGDRIHVDDFNHYVDDLALVVERVRSELPLVIYGHSMGGLIAAAYAESDHPQPAVYVLSAPALAAEVPAALRAMAKYAGRILPGLRLQAPTKGEQLSRDPAVGEAYFADPLVDLKGTARFGAELFEAMDRTTANVHDISVPALVIHGGDDTLVPPAASAPLAAVDGIDRRVFPGLRHEMHNEPEAKEVLDFVASWLDDHV
jgi:alpha-beta hydrolase superfamily lysophospholipase